ncbi:MAG: Fe-S cluster assembly protein SufB, partial [Planctomycetota bacterium]
MGAEREPAGVPSATREEIDLQEVADREYEFGFVTDIEADALPPGLSEEIVAEISRRKEEPEWLLEYRLRAYRHWRTMAEPDWAFIDYPPVDYENIIYYSAPKPKKKLESLDEVDPELLET